MAEFAEEKIAKDFKIGNTRVRKRKILKIYKTSAVNLI